MYQKILLPIDLGEQASWDKALPRALTLCQTFKASLHLVTVLPEFRLPVVGAHFPKDYSRKAHAAITKAQHAFVDQHVPDDVVTQCVVADGSPWEAIVSVSNTLEVDLIVMASRNRHKLMDYVLGPNAEHVVHHASMSVMVVR